ncbi:hypothetical protein DY000_02024120 [Brassica cretica]|uniref:Uncharacterized protein n=1 Tax=Brassica cretica TaxID=69181 RepID=A0ABQ7EEH4_BRACR|nr:hypothetical protein DY000_02024120 [Brassica cretica]
MPPLQASEDSSSTSNTPYVTKTSEEASEFHLPREDPYSWMSKLRRQSGDATHGYLHGEIREVHRRWLLACWTLIFGCIIEGLKKESSSIQYCVGGG